MPGAVDLVETKLWETCFLRQTIMILLYPVLEMTGFMQSGERFVSEGGQCSKRVLEFAPESDCKDALDFDA